MATHNVEIGSNQNPLECCDVCGSDDVIEIREGYTCRDCGGKFRRKTLTLLSSLLSAYDPSIRNEIVRNTLSRGFLK